MSDSYDDDDEYTERERVDTEVDPNPSEQGKWVSMVVALLGLWLLVEAVVFDLSAANFWNDVIIGVALIVLGGYNYYRRADERFGSVSVGAFAALLGLWLLAAPFVLTPDAAAEMTLVDVWNDVIVGLLVLVLGAYSAYQARRDAKVGRAART